MQVLSPTSKPREALWNEIKLKFKFEPIKCKGPQNASGVIVWCHVPLLPGQLARPHQVRAAQGGEQGVGAVAFFLQMTFNYVLMSCSRTLTWTAYLFHIFQNWSTPPKCSPLWLPAHRDAGRGSSSKRRWRGRRPGDKSPRKVKWDWGIASMKKNSWYLFISEDFLCFVQHLMSEMSCSLGIKKCLMKYCQFVYWLPQYKILEKYYTFRHNFRQRPCL